MQCQILFSLTNNIFSKLSGQFDHSSQSGVQLGRDNYDIMKSLYQHWLSAYPEAGEAYASTRSWTLLCWQPALLAVTSIHLLNGLPNLFHLKQKYKNGTISGYELTNQWFDIHEQSSGIICAGRVLRQMSEQLLFEFQQVAPVFKKKSALRALADNVLTILIQLYQWRNQLQPDIIHTWSKQWLKAMSLEGASNIMDLPTSTKGLGLNRKTCCLHYRRHDGQLCASCPKRPLSIRKKLLAQEWQDYA